MLKKLLFMVLCVYTTACFGEFHSQFQQDKMVYLHYFQKLKEGIFVDIGAHNGVDCSNSLFFEELGWGGICVEPNPDVFAELKANRKCLCIEGCISDRNCEDQFLKVISSTYPLVNMLSGLLHKYDPRHLEKVNSIIKDWDGHYELTNVNCFTLNSVLEKSNISHVNYLSIDTEGGEFDIIKSIDFSKVLIDVITVEENYSDNRITMYMKENGFIRTGKIGVDLMFVRSDFVPYK